MKRHLLSHKILGHITLSLPLCCVVCLVVFKKDYGGVDERPTWRFR